MVTDSEYHLMNIRTNFYIGNYQKCINEASDLKNLDSVEKNVLVYRSFMAQRKYAVVLMAVADDNKQEMRVLKLHCELASEKKKPDDVATSINLIMNEGNVSDLCAVLLANTFLLLDDFENALRVLAGCASLESHYLKAHIYLLMDRLDLAKIELAQMHSIDEDAILSQLATAETIVYEGGEKVLDAYNIYCELAERNSDTSFLLNNKAMCLLCLKRKDEALECLKRAYDMDNNDSEILFNLLMTSPYSSQTSHQLLELQTAHKHHPFVQDLFMKDNQFDEISTRLSTL